MKPLLIHEWGRRAIVFAIASALIASRSALPRLNAQGRPNPDPVETPRPPQVILPAPAVVEPGVIPGEPTPILDKPSLFPRESVVTPAPVPVILQVAPPPPPTPEPPANSAESADPNLGGNNPILTSVSSGAASAFGIDLRDQGSTRPSVAGTQAAAQRDRILARAERQATLQNYNIKLGPLPLRFAAGLDMQFSDNINNGRSHKLADFIVTPHLDIYGSLKLSRFNSFSIELGLGYLKDFNRPDQDRALTSASVGLDSNSQIAFDLKLGHFLINFHERPQIPRQHADLLNQRQAIEFGQFTNTVGVSVIWDVNSRFSINLGYDHFNSFAIQSALSTLDQSAEQFSFSTSYRMSDALSLGFQANASVVKYSQAFLNDATNYSFGPTFQARLTPFVSLQGGFGYQIGQYASGGGIGDGSNLNSWYGNLNISNRLNTRISQTLSLGHESQLGIASNFTEVSYIRHQVNWNVIQDVSLGTHLSFQDGDESGGRLAQHFRLWEAGFFGNYALSRKLSLSFFYRFVNRESSGDGSLNSSRDDLSYYENRLDLNLRYSF